LLQKLVPVVALISVNTHNHENVYFPELNGDRVKQVTEKCKQQALNAQGKQPMKGK
jgi:hypothetical protein